MVTPVKQGEKTIGYTISFTKGEPITIYHGEKGDKGEQGDKGETGDKGDTGDNGKDGTTPTIGVKQHADGIYYWTLNGDWLRDNSGNMIKAEGKDGADGEQGEEGKAGITPQLKIEDGYWWVSYGEESGWIQLDKVVADNGETIFKEVTQDDDYVYFTLKNETVITIQKYRKLSITFKEGDDLKFDVDETKVVHYTIKSESNKSVIKVEMLNNDGCYSLHTDITNTTSGTITIKASVPTTNQVIVSVSNGEVTIMVAINVSLKPALEENTIRVSEAGTLAKILEGYDKNSITTLKVIGSINDNDIVALRILPKLSNLDLEDVYLTSLPRHAFSQNKTLTSIKLPKTLKEIGSYAFTTSLYRSLLFPRKFYELDAAGQPVHYSPYNGQVLPGYMYTDTGFWDTFRCLFPLLNLMYPSVNKEMQEGLINTYKESGFFPEWASPGHRGCMVGNNSASVLVDAYMKGVKVDDIKTLYEGLIHGTENVHPQVSSTGRLGYKYYNKLGYVPYDVKINENAARTLEYAYNDWCIYQLAKELKRPKKEINLFAKRAMNYKNLFDKESKLMRGRNEDGTFQSPFSPLKWGDAFTEGNSWHYTWSVFHDPQGLIDLMGGKEMFITMMDSVFAVPPIFDDSYYGQVIHEIREMTVMNMGNYAHGNQPIQHMIYLYDYAGQPWKAQYWLRQVMDRMYSPTPDGYCGDEDNGQTSAWYVFSALGFYPVCPGTDEYIIGAPLFKKATFHFENGNSLVIDAPNNSKKKFYVNSMNVNGADYTKNYLRHENLLKGGTINVEMSNQPNQNRGTKEEDMPYSFSKQQ